MKAFRAVRTRIKSNWIESRHQHFDHQNLQILSKSPLSLRVSNESPNLAGKLGMSTAGWRLLQRLEVHNADLALAELPERTKANLGAREVGKFKVSLDLLYQAEDWMKGAENKESAAPRM
eukprot:1075466-Amorphochlora_amoeboformis.AAC.1